MTGRSPQVAERPGGPPARPPRARLGRGRALPSARRAAWWAVVATCVLYAGFAVVLGLLQASALLGLGDAPGPRGAPLAFAVHATAGGVALVTGVLQLDAGTFARGGRAHRAVGRVYGVAAWCASLAGLWSALAFDVAVAARVAFAAAAVLWFATTTAGVVQVRRGRFARHREWMLRSVALALFFVVAEAWTAVLRATPLPEAIAYPVAVVIAWAVNLGVAEAWIRRTRR